MLGGVDGGVDGGECPPKIKPPPNQLVGSPCGPVPIA